MLETKTPEEQQSFHDINIEFSLIGHVLCDNGLMSRLTAIRPQDFFSDMHEKTWEAMELLYRKGESISPFTIQPVVANPDDFDIAGGVINYLGGSVNQSILNPYPLDQEKYLIRLSQQRRIKSACHAAIEMPPRDAANMLISAATNVINDRPTEDFSDNYQITETILNDLKSEVMPDRAGIKNLDEAMGGGLYAGKTYGFAGRKKMGKTIFAGTVSHNLNLAGVKHLFICGEMSPAEIQQRVLSRATDSFPSAFRTGYGQSHNFQKKIADYAYKMPRNVLYKNAPGVSFDELKRIYTTAIDRHHVKGIILDYWQLVGGKTKGQSDSSHLDDVAQWIANYSRERGVWSIVMAQLNQDDNTRGSEGIRLAFDQVYRITAPNNDPTISQRSLEMIETRYTEWANVDGLRINPKGLYFEECQ
jgi:replicative DNA helicase